MTMQIFDCEQGSPEWHACRLGVPTASMFKAILAKGEGLTRRSYMLKLAGELVTGEPGENYSNAYMDRGKVMEDEARSLYALVHDEDLHRVGFIRNGDVGASPDSLIGVDGGLEIKTQRADLLIDTLLKDKVPSEHVAQIQGNMWVSERAWWDIVVYWPRMPLFRKRVVRDDAYIKELEAAVKSFSAELQETVSKVHRWHVERAA